MSQTDPIADFITCIRNACLAKKKKVVVFHSNIKEAIAKILVREGFLSSCETEVETGKKLLGIKLKYGPNGEEIIHKIRRISTPGRRVYKRRKEISRVVSGLGVGVISTPKGIITDKECRRSNVGGEYLLEVW